MSWWVGKNRDELRAAIAEREPIWRAQKQGHVDMIGAAMMRDAWEPRRPMRKESHG